MTPATLSAALFVALSLVATPAGSAATDVAAQTKILKTAEDFRSRVDACLKLGGSGDFKARKPLEEALDDPHPTVRQAAAGSLAKLGDVLAIAALESRLGKEKNPPTKASIQNAISALKSSSGSSSGGSSSSSSTGGPDWAKTKYVVKLQHVSNVTGIRGDALSAVLDGSARSRLSQIEGVYVLPSDASSASIMTTASSKGLPILGVDAKVVLLDQATFAGDLKIQAKVSFAISKTMVIKSSIEGNASSIGSINSAKNPKSLEKLQDMAIDGAVTSAMAKAPSALAASAK
jgi:hypothetical protein